MEVKPKWARIRDLAKEYGLKDWYLYNLVRQNEEVKELTRRMPGPRGPIVVNREGWDDWFNAQK